MIIKYKKRKIEIKKYKTVSWLGKFSGLMFRTNETPILEFSFKNDVEMAIHSYFVFFTFIAVWVDSDDKAFQVDIVKPFTSLVKPQKHFRKLIEIPFNSENRRIIEFFVGKRKV